MGASLLSFSLILRPVLKFQSVRTALMRNFDLNFSERRKFVFFDVCMSSFCELHLSSWSQDFCALPVSRLHFSENAPHFRHHLFSVFCWVDLQLAFVQTSTYHRIYIPIQIYRTGIREDANSHRVIRCKYLS